MGEERIYCMQHDFHYVSKREYSPVKEHLWNMIHEVQKDLRKDYFTFQFVPIGSSSRNMITRDKKSNVGYDFDINLYPNVGFDEYSPKELRTIITKAFNKFAAKYGYSPCEDSTRVITLKVKDRENSKILHSCDMAIVLYDEDEDPWYIQCRKNGNKKYYEKQLMPDPDELEEKIAWIKDNDLWDEVKNMYINLKNHNTNSDRKSRSMFAEAINNIYNEY